MSETFPPAASDRRPSTKTAALSRRGFLKTAAAAGLAAGPTRALASLQDRRTRPPNMVLIMADDLGYECIGANGGTSYKTPTLDRLARTGTRFEHCYAQPLCTPTRVQLMTGIYNVRNYVRFGLLDPAQTTFAHLLKKAGYATCVVGKWQLGGGFEGPAHFGFDEYCLWQLTRRPGRYPNPGLEVNGKEIDYRNGQYGPDLVCNYACDFITRNKDRPFLLYYPMILTHCPFEPTPDSPDWDPKSPGSKTYKGNPKYFAEMVAYMDKIIARIIGRLDELGLRQTTLVLFTGDNGTDAPIVSMMGEKAVKAGKGQTTDAGTRVPLIANWPGTIPAGRLCSDLVDSTDFLPTLCQCAKVTVPRELNIDGRSFLPQLLGRSGNPRQWTYCWYSRNGGPKGREFARNQRFKLYRTGQFYDIQNDVLEKNPLGPDDLDPAAAAARKMLQDALEKFSNARPRRLLRPTQKKKQRQR